MVVKKGMEKGMMVRNGEEKVEDGGEGGVVKKGKKGKMVKEKGIKEAAKENKTMKMNNED